MSRYHPDGNSVLLIFWLPSYWLVAHFSGADNQSGNCARSLLLISAAEISILFLVWYPGCEFLVSLLDPATSQTANSFVVYHNIWLDRCSIERIALERSTTGDGMIIYPPSNQICPCAITLMIQLMSDYVHWQLAIDQYCRLPFNTSIETLIMINIGSRC